MSLLKFFQRSCKTSSACNFLQSFFDSSRQLYTLGSFIAVFFKSSLKLRRQLCTTQTFQALRRRPSLHFLCQFLFIFNLGSQLGILVLRHLDLSAQVDNLLASAL